MLTMKQQHAKIFSDLSLLQENIPDNKTIVFTNGCFDLLHEGHLYLLSEAGKLGDVLIVAVNSDASVKRLKGDNRPIEELAIRCKHLAELDDVQYIISFEEDTPIQLIRHLHPHVLVKGGDYAADKIAGAEFVIQCGGEVVIIPLLEGYSTTKIIAEKK